MSAMQEKIVEMLGAGVTPVQVARAVGCEESYVSQILAVPELHGRITELRAVRAAQYIEHDDTIEEMEKRALVRLSNAIDFLRPMEALKAFQVLNSAKKKSDAASRQDVPTSTVVNINLPAAAITQFKLTSDKQVIEVDGRSMATMPAAKVAQMLREKKAGEQLQEALGAPLVIDTPAFVTELDRI